MSIPLNSSKLFAFFIVACQPGRKPQKSVETCPKIPSLTLCQAWTGLRKIVWRPLVYGSKLMMKSTIIDHQINFLSFPGHVYDQNIEKNCKNFNWMNSFSIPMHFCNYMSCFFYDFHVFCRFSVFAVFSAWWRATMFNMFWNIFTNYTTFW